MALTVTPCDCCSTPPVGCDCCPEGPSQPLPFTISVTFNDDLEWDVDDPATCDRIIFEGGTPYTFTLIDLLNCAYILTFDPEVCNGAFIISCDGGVWYLSGSIFYNTVLYEIRWALPDFLCCATEQTIELDLIYSDPIFITLPTEIAIESVGCFDPCDCPCCTGGVWSEYTMTVAGITDGCAGCTTLNGSWTLSYVGTCGWETATPVPGFCTGAGPYWTLVCTAGTWILGSHVDGPMYTTTDDLCVEGGTLNLIAPGVICSTYPATLTVTPGGTFVPCPEE